MEMLDVRVVERATGAVLGRSVGNNFSSYVRDHDFSVVLPARRATSPGTEEPDGFGDLHGRLFRHL
ncbi:putative oxygenase MesX, partial [Corynebacterium diphtheriae]